MRRMLGSVRTLMQHFFTLDIDPSTYKPKRCPQCGATHLWTHGIYYRKGDRSLISENRCVLIPIPRFCCRHCKATCSRLPACLSPRHWYPWSAQRFALLLVFAGIPPARIRDWTGASVDTIKRWHARLIERGNTSEFHLPNTLPNLGCRNRTDALWLAMFGEPDSSETMVAVIYRQGAVAP
uniref:Transposase n=1 Tax=Candidatus Kentrum sp. MB TaxID=2138164 RepID=A0A451B9A1_9GAMM|nr:MAG: hypothetical protein BECKMB1821G_GA0114241_101533 [Candidatus Kentron sp. MB]VFK29682.1 MAG: hypothetical protein BECKMB1821I_GA0114274_101132 [Candidatus Kentron sp. MB]VFK74869.1 MAG: hypothetical protein BECKMB1821H_GA0114242_101132 [Candidatus Kentron sp. MB]